MQLIISRDLWSQINLEYANKSELFERVLKENFKTSAGLYEKEPFDLAEIKYMSSVIALKSLDALNQ